LQKTANYSSIKKGGDSPPIILKTHIYTVQHLVTARGANEHNKQRLNNY